MYNFVLECCQFNFFCGFERQKIILFRFSFAIPQDKSFFSEVGVRVAVITDVFLVYEVNHYKLNHWIIQLRSIIVEKIAY